MALIVEFIVKSKKDDRKYVAQAFGNDAAELERDAIEQASLVFKLPLNKLRVVRDYQIYSTTMEESKTKGKYLATVTVRLK